MSTVTYQVQTILKDFGQNDFYELLKKAYTQFCDLTGKCDSDSPEYEARMNSFNDWYVFHFENNDEKKIFVRYFDEHGVDSELAKAFYNVNYSVFKVQKVVKGKIYLTDILHDQRLKVLEEDSSVGLVPEDIFVGRTVFFDKRHYLLKGVCTIPRESFSEVEKYSKKIRSNYLYNNEENFLLNLEKLKVKSMHYKHLPSSKIFSLTSLAAGME